MKHCIAMTGLAAALLLPALAAPTRAAADCRDRKTTGTVVGGVGGALLGNSISGGGGGAILGGLGGAVLGHEVAKGSCGPDRRGEYRARYRHRHHRPYEHRVSRNYPDPGR